MLFFKKICALLMFAFSNANAATIDLGAVSEVGVGRVGNNVVRYVKNFSNSCLEVQVISPSLNWKILAASNYCGFDGKSFDHDFADAGFEEVSVKADGVHSTLSITALRPVREQRRKCLIPVEGAVIKALKCSEVLRDD